LENFYNSVHKDCSWILCLGSMLRTIEYVHGQLIYHQQTNNSN